MPAVRPGNSTERTNLICEVPAVYKDKVEEVLKGRKRGKAAGD